MNLLLPLFEYLNTKCNYAVLRNYEGLPEKNNSRDIDIIIEKKEYVKVKRQIVELIVSNGWQIITYLHSDRLITYVCGRIDKSSTQVIQLDFFFNTSIQGILLIDAPELLEHRVFNGKIYHLTLEYEFLDKYLYNRTVGKPYPQKYLQVKQTVSSNKAVIEKTKKLFGVISIEQADRTAGRQLLLNALSSNMRSRPVEQLVDIAQFVYSYVANYIQSNTGFSVGFTGPDGSGKTTVLETLHKQLSPVFESAAQIFHFRPTLFGNLGDAAHSMGVKKEVDRDYSNPHRGTKTGSISSLLRLFYYSIDYVIGYFVKVKSACRITRIVIFDRYYTDITADSRRSRIFLNTKFLYYWGKLFIPSLNYNILLTADADTILARKQELDREGIDRINNKLDYLKDKKGYYLVLNNGKPEEAVRKILTLIFDEQHRRNLKRLNVCTTPKND